MAWYTHLKSVENIHVKVVYRDGATLTGRLAKDGTLTADRSVPGWGRERWAALEPDDRDGWRLDSQHVPGEKPEVKSVICLELPLEEDHDATDSCHPWWENKTCSQLEGLTVRVNYDNGTIVIGKLNSIGCIDPQTASGDLVEVSENDYDFKPDGHDVKSIERMED